MKIALAQLNPTVGDVVGNTELILEAVARARREGASVVVTPELAVFGYPPKDLVLRRDLVARNLAAVERIARACTEVVAVVGYVHPDSSGNGKGVFNAAAVCRGGRVDSTYYKMLLPTYDVFDEARYFSAGRDVRTIDLVNGGSSIRFGLCICEDLWNDEQFEGRNVYGEDPIERTVAAGARVLINLSASPFRADVAERREKLFSAQVREHGTPLIYVNQAAANDDLVFDGGSLVLDAKGRVVLRARAFEPDFAVITLEDGAPAAGRVESYPATIPSIRAALVLGIRDYLRKCDFRDVVLGLSGGIDSAVTAALAVEALGADHVFGVAMPSRYSSECSLEDARALASALGMSFSVVPIEPAHQCLRESLSRTLGGPPGGLTDENLQARIRGNLLMAISNATNRLLLSTGNKSEWAVGYCTLYGDMCGGLAVLSDVPKTIVYELAREINGTANREVIPRRTMDRPPTAELREQQTDQDTLPSYPVLDAILQHYVEEEMSADAIVALGFDRSVVEEVLRLVKSSEYKRKQAPVGLKVTSLAFGTGRRMPIAAKY